MRVSSQSELLLSTHVEGMSSLREERWEERSGSENAHRVHYGDKRQARKSGTLGRATDQKAEDPCDDTNQKSLLE